MDSQNFQANATPPQISIRTALNEDIDFILKSEIDCFAEHRRSNRRSIANSIKSVNQAVYIAEITTSNASKQAVGVAIAFLYKRSLRIYSLAVSPQYRHLGAGEALLQALLSLSEQLGHNRVTLEADTANNLLINWYRKFGFEISQHLQDYYREGESAYRMLKKNTELNERLILITDEGLDLETLTECPVYYAKEYLSNPTLFKANSYHVLNFCNSHKTHSIGYYVSLLATARNHRIIPPAMSFTDYTNPIIAQSILDEIQSYLLKRFKKNAETSVTLTIILGKTVTPKYSEIGKKIFSLFNLPLFTLELEKKKKWQIKKIRILSLKQVLAEWPEVLKKSLYDYQNTRYRRRHRLQSYKYDLAILVDPAEAHPPSCPIALKKFAQAAEKVGFLVEFITKADKRRICEFDAIFIRETTTLANHTYAMARHAYTEGLVVIDDPWSILLCSNKIYLHERLTNAGILQPQGWLLTKKSSTADLPDNISYPLVLKLPDSSFSLGVFRVNNATEMALMTKQLFAKSDLVLVQEFLASDYDWRIGVLDNQPLFACKYYMANEHWQIYNWQSEIAEECSGRHETVPTQQVPPHVLKTALKVAALIGNGLYGIDIKEVGQKAYVIEINDNPNIDFEVEDTLLGDELYERIMYLIYNRIEIERHQTRYLL